jgi:hypothetical protein
MRRDQGLAPRLSRILRNRLCVAMQDWRAPRADERRTLWRRCPAQTGGSILLACRHSSAFAARPTRGERREPPSPAGISWHFLATPVRWKTADDQRKRVVIVVVGTGVDPVTFRLSAGPRSQICRGRPFPIGTSGWSAPGKVARRYAVGVRGRPDERRTAARRRQCGSKEELWGGSCCITRSRSW